MIFLFFFCKFPNPACACDFSCTEPAKHHPEPDPESARPQGVRGGQQLVGHQPPGRAHQRPQVPFRFAGVLPVAVEDFTNSSEASAAASTHAGHGRPAATATTDQSRFTGESTIKASIVFLVNNYMTIGS